MEFTYNISFEISGAFILIVLLVCTYLQYPEASRGYRAYQNLVAALLIGEIFDIVSAIANSLPAITPLALGTFINIAYLAISAVCQYMLVDYVRVYSDEDKLSRTMLILDRIVLVPYMALVLTTFATGWVFNYSTGEYTHGILYCVVYLISVYYMACAIILILHNRHNFTHRQLIFCFTFIAITILGMLLQVTVFPNVLLTYFGASLAALVYLFALETPDYQKLTKTMEDLDYLRKNLQNEVTKQTQLAVERQHHLEELSFQTVQALAHSIDAKDEYTNGHSSRVAEYAAMLAKRLGWPDERVESLRYAATLHDIGKIGVPDNILNKPGRLNDFEYKLIQTHTVVGSDILKNVDSIPMASEIALSHHERWDGKGYPNGLKAEEIPEEARVVGIADAYDAMSSDRVYRIALSKERTREELVSNRGKQFDPEILDVFLAMFDEGLFSGMRGKAIFKETAMHTALLGFQYDPTKTITLDELIQAITGNEDDNGPVQAPYEGFNGYYEHIARTTMNKSEKITVILFRMEPNSRKDFSTAQLDNAMMCLDLAIRQSIRSTDFYTRLNTHQYSLVIVGASSDIAAKAIDRIVKGYYRLYEESYLHPVYEFCLLDNS